MATAICVPVRVYPAVEGSGGPFIQGLDIKPGYFLVAYTQIYIYRLL